MPKGVRSQLWQQLAPYRHAHPKVRWTRPRSWHLTLVFLGSVDPSQVPGLAALVATVSRDVQPYRATADRGGGRARQRDGVAWLGLSEGAGTLLEAASLVAAGCPPEIVADTPPRRTPSAHLTLVRMADEAVIAALRGEAAGPVGVSWTVNAIELVRSHLEPDGARYETLHRSTL